MVTKTLNECCEKYGYNADPRQPRRGQYIEIHTCPTCNSSLRLTDEESPLLSGDAFTSVAGVEPA